MLLVIGQYQWIDWEGIILWQSYLCFRMTDEIKILMFLSGNGDTFDDHDFKAQDGGLLLNSSEQLPTDCNAILQQGKDDVLPLVLFMSMLNLND